MSEATIRKKKRIEYVVHFGRTMKSEPNHWNVLFVVFHSGGGRNMAGKQARRLTLKLRDFPAVRVAASAVTALLAARIVNML